MWNEVEIQKIKQDIQRLYDKIEKLRTWISFFIGTTIAFAGYAMYLAFFVE